MTFWLFCLLVLFGGLGACTRFVLDGWIKSRTHSAFPWSTAIINMTGSLVLGFLTGLLVSRIADTDVSAVIGTGFLGGYTTFSTASYELVQLLERRRTGLALTYGFGVLAVCVALAFGGYYLGKEI